MASRSQHYRTKVTSSLAPSARQNSKPSERQRVLLADTATRPSCDAALRPVACVAAPAAGVVAHDAENPFHIDRQLTLSLVLPVQQAPGATVTMAAQFAESDP